PRLRRALSRPAAAAVGLHARRRRAPRRLEAPPDRVRPAQPGLREVLHAGRSDRAARARRLPGHRRPSPARLQLGAGREAAVTLDRRGHILMATGAVALVLWQGVFFRHRYPDITLRSSDYILKASGGVLGWQDEFLYFLYYLNLYPVAMSEEPSDYSR